MLLKNCNANARLGIFFLRQGLAPKIITKLCLYVNKKCYFIKFSTPAIAQKGSCTGPKVNVFAHDHVQQDEWCTCAIFIRGCQCWTPDFSKVALVLQIWLTGVSSNLQKNG